MTVRRKGVVAGDSPPIDAGAVFSMQGEMPASLADLSDDGTPSGVRPPDSVVVDVPDEGRHGRRRGRGRKPVIDDGDRSERKRRPRRRGRKKATAAGDAAPKGPVGPEPAPDIPDAIGHAEGGGEAEPAAKDAKRTRRRGSGRKVRTPSGGEGPAHARSEHGGRGGRGRRVFLLAVSSIVFAGLVGFGCKLVFDGLSSRYASDVDHMLAMAESSYARAIARGSETGLAQSLGAQAQPTASAPTGAKPTEGGPAEAKPTGAKPTESAPSGTDASDAKPADAKPTDAKATDAKPAEKAPSEESSEAKPAGAEAAQAASASHPSVDEVDPVVMTSEHPEQAELDARGVDCPRERVFLDSKGDWAYVVGPSDTLSSISARFAVTVDELAAYNHIEDNDMIYDDSVLRIPVY